MENTELHQKKEKILILLIETKIPSNMKIEYENKENFT